MTNPMFDGKRGLGVMVCDDTGCYDDGSGSTSVYGTSGAGQQSSVGGGATGIFTDYTTGIKYSTNSNTSVAGIMTGIASSFSNIFKSIQPLPAGCTQVAGPYGTSTQCVGATGTSTLNLSSSLNSSLSSILTGSSSSLLLIGGAVLVVIMMSKR